MRMIRVWNDVTVLAYYISFEKGIIKKLLFFQKKWYVTPSMQGSYSIKYVLPSLVPEFEKSYKEIDRLQNGSQTMNAFTNMSNLNEINKQKIKKLLLSIFVRKILNKWK
jgi:hypothetical protein